MKTRLLTIDQLKRIPVITVEQGKQLASDILDEQLAIHRQMQSVNDIKEWQVLSDRHFYLRKIRQSVLHNTGLMAIKQKQATKR
jgi:hypothetical protein